MSKAFNKKKLGLREIPPEITNPTNTISTDIEIQMEATNRF